MQDEIEETLEASSGSRNTSGITLVSEGSVPIGDNDSDDRCLRCNGEITDVGVGDHICICWSEDVAPLSIAKEVSEVDISFRDGMIYDLKRETTERDCEDCVHAYKASCPKLAEAVSAINNALGDMYLEDVVTESVPKEDQDIFWGGIWASDDVLAIAPCERFQEAADIVPLF